MKGSRVPPWTIGAFGCLIVSLFTLIDLVSAQEPREIAPLPSSPSVMNAKPEPVAQVACTYSILPVSHAVSSAEETGSISVTTAPGCGWMARSNAAWITVGPEASGTGNGRITYSVHANQATAPRTGAIVVEGQIFQLTQAPIPQHTLTVSKAGSGQGRVSSNLAGDVFKKGTGVALRAIPDDNSVFAGWQGACSGTSVSCNLQMTSDKTVTATFVLKTYTIRVPTPFNGVIHPSGAIKVPHGEKRRFQVIPLPGYRVSEVLVDKVSVGAVNSYTFDNVRSDHVLEAVFVEQ